MKATDLSADQRRSLSAAACRRRDYYARLRDRMETTGWDRDDETYKAVDAACKASHDLVRAINDSRPPDAPVPAKPPFHLRTPTEPLNLPPLPEMPWVGKRRGRRRR